MVRGQLAGGLLNIVFTFIYTKYNIHHVHCHYLLCILTLLKKFIDSRHSNTSKYFIIVSTLVAETSTTELHIDHNLISTLKYSIIISIYELLYEYHKQQIETKVTIN